MLIAYRPYSQLDENSRPLGILPQTPWTLEHIEDVDADAYRVNGWTVLTPEDYAIFEASLIPENAKAMALASIKSGVLTPAMTEGDSILKDFIAENVLLGITQDGMTATVLSRMGEVIDSLQTGSLYDAIQKARDIPASYYDAKYITPTRLLIFINRVEKYLGLPISGAL
jgi:hypothetical protein